MVLSMKATKAFLRHWIPELITLFSYPIAGIFKGVRDAITFHSSALPDTPFFSFPTVFRVDAWHLSEWLFQFFSVLPFFYLLFLLIIVRGYIFLEEELIEKSPRLMIYAILSVIMYDVVHYQVLHVILK